MDKLREEFEEKLSHDYGDDALLKNSDGDYVDWLTADLWGYWQASRSSIVVELPDPKEDRARNCSSDDIAYGFNQGVGKCKDVIRSIGLSIKGE
ncbi:TPA: hypothetical protein ACXJM1_001188 [Serratia marcescens]